jgi:uncharacterized NAD(P)/FAD-binding protein YdhS
LSQHIAVVGGGASGLLTAIHLVRCGYRGRITLIERSAQTGEGIAYSTRRAEHLLNVPAANMSAFGDEPDHFVRYLRAHRDAAYADDIENLFAQRRHYAEYLRHTFVNVAKETQLLNAEAVAIRFDSDCVIETHEGKLLHCDGVVLATGNFPRRALHDHAPAAARVPGWNHEAIAAIRADEDICIIGTGLSMVDAMVTLSANAHRGHIHLVSRHGLLPLPRIAHGVVEVDIDAFLCLSLTERTRSLHRTARDMAKRGEPWQWLMDALRPHVVQMWQTLSHEDQRRFLRHAARFWDVHRHRIPPSAAATLDAMRESGRVSLHVGGIKHAEWRADGFHLQTRDAAFTATRVIDCSGIQLDIRRAGNPLIDSLLRAGKIRPGQHGIGIDTDAHAAAIDANGNADPRLSVIGSARIGQLWESIAIPELRQQAAAIARRLVTGATR